MIDVITPCYNSSRYLSQTVASVLTQTYRDWKLWLINDGSEDNTLDLITQWMAMDDRIMGLDLGQNTGSRISRNIGVEQGSGEFLIHLDSDDMLSPDFMQATLEAIGDHAYCYTDNFRVRVGSGELEYHRMPDFSLDWLRAPEGYIDRAPMVTALQRRLAFEAVGGFDPAYPAMECVVLHIKMAVQGYFGVRLGRPLFWHRFGKDFGHWLTCARYVPETEWMLRTNYPDFFAGRVP